MQQISRVTSWLVAGLLVLVCAAAVGADEVEHFRWQDQELTPSEIHQKLAENKALALERSRSASRPAPPPTAAGDQTSFDVLYYDVTIRVNDTTEILYGKVHVAANSTVGALTSADIDLLSNMVIDSIVGTSGQLAFSRIGDVVTVTLGQTYAIGETFAFDIWYSGHPTEGGFQAFSFDSYNGKPMISSLSEPYYARSWWPCKDRMDDKPDSMDMHIEIDTSMYCASNGLLDSITVASPNSHTFHWRVRYPITTYLFSVAIYDYTVWTDEWVYNDDLDTLPLVHAVYPSWYNTSLTSYGQTPDYLRALSAAFGPYPFAEEKYGHANFEWGGGMEHQTMTSMIGSSFGFSEPVIVHELGHQWWGDMITCKSWEDIWLNEGWASYAEAVYYLDVEGWASYRSYMNSMRYTGGGTIWVDDTTSVWRIFNGGLSYDKGAWACHMLRGVLGETKWAQGVEAYYNSEHQYAAANTEDFKNVFEAATGEELDWYFEDWIYGTYYPKYSMQWMSEPSDSGGYDFYVFVEQTQTTSPQVFRMPVDLFIDYTTQPDDTVIIKCDQRKKFFKINGPGAASNLLLDPSDWILKTVNYPAWTMHIITFPEDISDGVQFVPYSDTVEQRGATNNLVVTVTSGAMPDGLSIDNNGVISGVPTTLGDFTFSVHFEDTFIHYEDSGTYTISIVENPSCCVGSKGDVLLVPNCDDGDQIVDIADLTNMIDHLFLTFADICCEEEADLAPEVSDGVIDIADLTFLINHLFITFEELPSCF